MLATSNRIQRDKRVDIRILKRFHWYWRRWIQWRSMWASSRPQKCCKNSIDRRENNRLFMILRCPRASIYKRFCPARHRLNSTSDNSRTYNKSVMSNTPQTPLTIQIPKWTQSKPPNTNTSNSNTASTPSASPSSQVISRSPIQGHITSTACITKNPPPSNLGISLLSTPNLFISWIKRRWKKRNPTSNLDVR